MKKMLIVFVMICIGFIGLYIHTVVAGDRGLSTPEEKFAEALQRIDELEKRVAVNEDIEQIKQLTYRYVTARTLNDGDGQAECFTDDGTLVHANKVGKKALTEFFRDHSAEIEAIDPFVGPYVLEKIRTDGHFLIHPVVSVDGDRAKGTWMEYCITSEPITMTLLYLVQATYDVEYVKRDGEWKIYILNFQRTIEPVRPGERIGRGAPPPDQK